MAGPIVGLDEVGTGALAGPLLVCAFAAPSESWSLQFLNDSKKLSKNQRTVLCKELLRAMPGRFELSWMSAEDIDRLGLQKALHMANEQALYRLFERVGTPWRVIADGNIQPIPGAECYPKADGTYPCVMAASVIAKVHRDEHMTQLALQYPQYGFDGHVGYGTARHIQAMVNYGLTPVHRKSYGPARALSSAR